MLDYVWSILSIRFLVLKMISKDGVYRTFMLKVGIKQPSLHLVPFMNSLA